MEKLGLKEDYEKRFGRTYYSSSADDRTMIDVETAKYLWKHTFNIDEVSKKFQLAPFEYSICPCRFSIGAVYFSRELFEEMGMFDVDSKL